MHGCNAEEFIQHVRDGRVDPKAAVISANSLAAEALGMADQIGSIAPGLQAESLRLTGTSERHHGCSRSHICDEGWNSLQERPAPLTGNPARPSALPSGHGEPFLAMPPRWKHLGNTEALTDGTRVVGNPEVVQVDEKSFR